METTVITVARVNGVDIQIIENGEKRVAVKPICDALGVAWEVQFRKLNSDPKFLSTITLMVTVGADGRQREMVTIPMKKVFGWLYSINAGNVKPEAREALLKYQEECNDALYNYFARKEEYLRYRQEKMNESFAMQLEARLDFSQAKERLASANEDLRKWATYSEEQYNADFSQLKLEFGEDK
jgi:hypothetical protein